MKVTLRRLSVPGDVEELGVLVVNEPPIELHDPVSGSPELVGEIEGFEEGWSTEDPRRVLLLLWPRYIIRKSPIKSLNLETMER